MTLSEKITADGRYRHFHVKEAVMRIFQKLEKSIINGNKLNYTRTISIIKEEVGEELSK